MSKFKPGQSGNPRGRKPGALRVLHLLEPNIQALIAKAVELALAGDTQALRLCLDRIAPPPRAESPAVKILKLSKAKTLPEKAAAVLDAVATGSISPDTGERLLGALAHAGQIIEYDAINKRLEALEKGAAKK